MKIYMTLLKVAVAGALLTPTFAQSGVNVSVDVPFTFRVGAENLPAGHYTFKANGGSALMMVQDAAGKHSAMTVTSRNAEETGPAEAQLVFRVYGTVRYLASVWGPNSIGRALTVSLAEREAAGTQIASLAVVHASASR